jgi:hypothetical protein
MTESSLKNMHARGTHSNTSGTRPHRAAHSNYASVLTAHPPLKIVTEANSNNMIISLDASVLRGLASRIDELTARIEVLEMEPDGESLGEEDSDEDATVYRADDGFEMKNFIEQDEEDVDAEFFPGDEDTSVSDDKESFIEAEVSSGNNDDNASQQKESFVETKVTPEDEDDNISQQKESFVEVLPRDGDDNTSKQKERLIEAESFAKDKDDNTSEQKKSFIEPPERSPIQVTTESENVNSEKGSKPLLLRKDLLSRLPTTTFSKAEMLPPHVMNVHATDFKKKEDVQIQTEDESEEEDTGEDEGEDDSEDDSEAEPVLTTRETRSSRRR